MGACGSSVLRTPEHLNERASGGSKDPDAIIRATGQPRELPKGMLRDLPETKLGAEEHYDILEVIGHGSFGHVYKGRHKKTGDLVALKILRRDRVRATSLQREFVILETLKRHKMPSGIAQYKGAYKTWDTLTFVFECLSGGELFDRIKTNGPYSERKAQLAFRPIVEALAFIHRHGIVHRDMKPENLLIGKEDDDTDLKLADFGLSQRIGKGAYLKKVCGTWAYAAPEMADPRRPGYSYPFDMWGFGVILFVTVAGYHPFDPHAGQDVRVIKERARRAQWDFNDPAWEPISGDCKDLISRLLRRNPRHRLSAEQVLQHRWVADVVPSANPLTLRLAADREETPAEPAMRMNGSLAKSDVPVPEVRRGSLGGPVESTKPGTLPSKSRRRNSQVVLSAADHRKLSTTKPNRTRRSWSPSKLMRPGPSVGSAVRRNDPPAPLTLHLRDRLLRADSACSWSTPRTFPEDPNDFCTSRGTPRGSPTASVPNPLRQSSPSNDGEEEEGEKREEETAGGLQAGSLDGINWANASQSLHETPLTHVLHKSVRGNVASQRNRSEHRRRASGNAPVDTNVMLSLVPYVEGHPKTSRGRTTALTAGGSAHMMERRFRSSW